MPYAIITFLLVFTSSLLRGQDSISMHIQDTEGLPIIEAYALLYPSQNYIKSDDLGNLKISKSQLGSTDSIIVKAHLFESLHLLPPFKTNYQITLTPTGNTLNTITVEAAQNEHLSSTDIGKLELSIRDIQLAPSFMGEVDVIKTIQLLPGVQSAGDGNSGLYVRGGGPDQNLMLLDGSTVYNASHLFGFFSVFNGDILNSVSITKGNMPANFGGRLSSVLEIGMKEASMDSLKITGSLGIVSSKLAIETPIVKKKVSLLLSARRTYIDLLAQLFLNKNSNLYGSGYFFYDLNGKITWQVGEKDKITLSSYYGKDKYTYKNAASELSTVIPWGNGIANIRHQHFFNPQLYLESQIGISNYNFSFNGGQESFTFELFSGIKDYEGKSTLRWKINDKHQITSGLQYIFHQFTPSTLNATSNDVEFDTGNPETLLAHDGAAFISHQWSPIKAFEIKYGARLSYFQHTGPFTRYETGALGQIIKETTYKKGSNIYDVWNIEPRISARYSFNENWSLKAAYSMVHQYIHLTALSTLSLPTDLWLPSTDQIKPERAHQYTLGAFTTFYQNKYEASIEIYYKSMENVVEYKEGASAQDNIKNNIDNLLTQGMGFAYGAEFYLKKKTGKFQGWIGYTIARSLRKFDDLNEGKVFPARYDRIHDLSLVAIYHFNKKWTLSAAFIFGSGSTFTVPKRRYLYEGKVVYEYGDRNGYRMAPYHRLDLSATYVLKRKEKTENSWIKRAFTHSLNLSIFNVYNRQNPYFVYFTNDGNIADGTLDLSAVQVSLFPIIPSLTYQFKF